jgi:phosphoribulokinase
VETAAHRSNRSLLSAFHDPKQFHVACELVVIPGGKLDLAMQLILTPLILQLVESKKRAS